VRPTASADSLDRFQFVPAKAYRALPAGNALHARVNRPYRRLA